MPERTITIFGNKSVSRDKVLFISHHRENSGWGESARRLIRAMDAAGLEVAAKPIRLSGGLAELDETVLKAEAVSSYGAKYLIQYTLPKFMEYSGHFKKCVGITTIDSFNLEYSGWLDGLSLMDEVWTLNTESTDHLSGALPIPVKTVSLPADSTIYNDEKVYFQLPENTFKFYTIADMNRRKNLMGILKAFHIAFPTDYPVALIIKVSKFGEHPEKVFDVVNSLTEKAKISLRLYPNIADYHNEIVMTDVVTQEAIYKLHKNCDCYVSASYGEGFCIPAFDAHCLGNIVIGTNTGGLRDFVPADYLVSGNREPVFGMMDSVPGLFSSREDWTSIDIRELSIKMLKAFNDKKPNVDAAKFSNINIGTKIIGLLNGQ